jgi:UDP-N-acetylglucosamine transferase subunit ALG13
MIFIMVGTHIQPFNRLLKEIDSLIENKIITEETIAQIGNSTYIPKNYKYERFFPEEDRNKLLKNSRLIITHAGAGCIIDSLMVGKIPIVVPRLKKYGEHNNDHQIDIMKEFQNQNKVISVYNLDDIGKKINKTTSITFKTQNSELIEKLKHYIGSLV